MISHGYVQWAWRQSQLTATQKLVLLAIACQCDDHGRTFARRSTISERCGIHKSGLSRHLKALSDAGLIELHPDGPIELSAVEVELQNRNAELQNRNARVAKSQQPSSSATTSGSSETPPTPPWGSLPPDLDTEDVKSALEEYHQHRREKKNLPTAVSWRRLIAKLKKWGPKRSVEAIEHSLANGWTGVFLPDENGSGRDVVADHGAYGTGHDPREDFR